MKGKATSIDIAHLAGVSQATVSRALRGSPLVNEETRRRVQAAAEQLNYKLDKNASNLRRMHTGTLALLFFEDPTADESHINPFFLSMLGSITRACARQGYDLLISFQQLSADWHADFADSKKADGIILLGYGDYLAYCDKLEKLVAQGTCFVRWGAVLEDQPGVSVGSDNFFGGHAVAAHLLERGCRRVAFLGDASSHYPEFFGRYRGYVEALENAGIQVDPVLQQNPKALEAVWDYSYDRVGYLGTNTPIDRCYECGYAGDFDPTARGFKCPGCGNEDSRTCDVVKRTCGYLGNPQQRPMVHGRHTEISARVKHMTDDVRIPLSAGE